jgi:hypothetical protein
MKKQLKQIMVCGAMLFAQHALAYNPGTVEEVCKKPKFTNFSLTEYEAPSKVQVPAQTDFSFAISNWIDPTTIKLATKDQKIPFTVENKNSFFLVHSKIPAQYTGKFVRLNAQATAILGCKSVIGWLIKVADQ